VNSGIALAYTSQKTLSRKFRRRESPVTGESTKETVKTIARGMPGESGCFRGDYACVLFSFARKAAGAASARHSLRPLSEGQDVSGRPRAKNTRRDREAVAITTLFEN
jgi:hypothetical protein